MRKERIAIGCPRGSSTGAETAIASRSCHLNDGPITGLERRKARS